MKLLVSDFDGTLYQNHMIDQDTLLQIKHWQNAGNYFIIATGRDFPSLVEKIKHYQISPDFIIGNNGATINQIALTKINQAMYRLLVDRIVSNEEIFREIKISHLSKNKIYSKRSTFTELKLKGLQNFFLEEKVIQLSVKAYSVEKANQFIEAHASNFPEVSFLGNIETIDIVGSSVNKLFTIQQLIKQLEISEKNVFTIGDGLNDWQMVNRYQSASFPWADSLLIKAVDHQVHNVGEFIKQISYDK